MMRPMTTFGALRCSLRLTACHRQFSATSGLEHYVEPCGTVLPKDFIFLPQFLNGAEQRVLLASALRKLDDTGSREARRKRRGRAFYDLDRPKVSDLFLPDEFYEFEEGHYDGVIKKFRETHATSWPDDPSLKNVLIRLRSLLPPVLRQDDIQTHLLHLASDGCIRPHVDNINSSGSWIAAVSLGGERVLRLEGPETFEVLLPSGSAYVQRDTVRYAYKHSIPLNATFKNLHIPTGQRLSVMLRDHLRPTVKTY